MEALITERGGYYRVKRGQSAAEIEQNLLTPVNGGVFAGAIIEVKKDLAPYKAAAGDCYASIARRFGCGEEVLRAVNGGRYVYPTAIIFVPAGNVEKNARGI